MIATARQIGFAPLAIGTAALLAAAIGATSDPTGFHVAWLVAALFWLTLSLGSLLIRLTWQITGGGWGEAIDEATRAGVAALPVGLLALLVPLFLGLQILYPWTAPMDSLPEVVQRKASWLDTRFFVGRTLVYAAIWFILAWRTVTRPASEPRSRALGAAGAILWVFTTTFFSFDWIMSLEPSWYSDIFGLFYCATTATATLAFALLATVLIRSNSDEALTARLQDCANLLLALAVGWIFLHFSQYLIIWMANQPHEIGWFIHRGTGGWRVVSTALLLFFFVLPVAALMFRRMKRSRRALILIAASVLVGHYLLSYWLVVPSFHHDGFAMTWLAPAAWLGIGGVWLHLVRRRLVTRGPAASGFEAREYAS